MKYKVPIGIDMQMHSMQQASGGKRRRDVRIVCFAYLWIMKTRPTYSRLVELYSHFNPALCHSLQRHIENIHESHRCIPLIDIFIRSWCRQQFQCGMSS